MFERPKERAGGGRWGKAAWTGLALSVLVLGFVAAAHPWPGRTQGEEHKLGIQGAAVRSDASAVPGSFADLARKLGPTVVNIKVTKVQKMAGPMGPEGPFGEFFKRFFQGTPPFPDAYRMQGAGSGVVISPDGYILTNHHVVEGAKEVMVTMADKKEFEAGVVGTDPKTDLAVLKIEAKEHLPVAVLGNSDDLQVGDWVLAIGNPFGLSNTVTSGIVSAKGRVIGAGPYDDFIQTDASINPGNSGGPLFNMAGEVVGINTAIVPQGQGIGFAIPANVAKPLIPQLESKGEVTRGYLGVSIQSLSPELAKALKLSDRKGALVAEVVSGSPADEAGIRRGDVIVAFDNQKIEDSRALSAVVARTGVGRPVTVTVRRDGEERELPVRVGLLPSEKKRRATEPKPEDARLGLQLQDVSPPVARQQGLSADRGALVVDVRDGSPAERAGLREGDVIVEVNHRPVKSVDEVKDELAKSKDGEPLLLLVKRQEGTLFVAIAG
jgi:serine protease Do